jgi:hypothetical protein
MKGMLKEQIFARESLTGLLSFGQFNKNKLNKGQNEDS